MFAGGAPLPRADLLELVAYTCERGGQPARLTNGTLLSRARAAGMKRAGLHRAGILLKGMGRAGERPGGKRGAFHAVMEGYAKGEAAGLDTEIRTPLNQ